VKSWFGIAFLALLALAGLHMASAAGVGGVYYLGLVVAGCAGLLIFLLIGQRGRAMPDRFLPDTEVEQPGSLVGLLIGLGALAAVGVALIATTADRNLLLAGYLFIIAAVITAARAIARFFDRREPRAQG
jgi:hypothetical protein